MCNGYSSIPQAMNFEPLGARNRWLGTAVSEQSLNL